ncbi:MAG TPA: hypothetical protein VFV68_14165 [Agriterribacter sp.]|nr:hypothetical protein [Agriterribacter sp.]
MKIIIGSIKVAICFSTLIMAIPFISWATQGISNHTLIQLSKPATSVEVINFSGRSVENNKIDLFCKIKSNCCYNIIVERSRNGKRFSRIATLSDNKQIAEYALSDDNPLHNTNYYRLKITDNKGNVKYSKLMIVQLYDTDDLSMVSVTPNTSLQDLRINVQLKNRAYIVMKLTNDKGQEVIKRKTTGKEGLNTFDLEGTGSMIPGNYHLEVLINSRDLLSLPLIKELNAKNENIQMN